MTSCGGGSVHAAVHKVQSSQAVSAVVLELSYVQTLPSTGADGMKRCDTSAMLQVVKERSLIALASGRVDSETAEFVVHKFPCSAHEELRQKKRLQVRGAGASPPTDVLGLGGAVCVGANTAFAAVQEKAFVEITAGDLVQATVPVLAAASQPAPQITETTPVTCHTSRVQQRHSPATLKLALIYVTIFKVNFAEGVGDAGLQGAHVKQPEAVSVHGIGAFGAEDRAPAASVALKRAAA